MQQTVYHLPLGRNSRDRPYTAKRASRRAMTIHERLKKARIAANYPSAAEAARAFGWSEHTTKSNENGHAPFGRIKASRYAKAYRVNLEWLLDGRGPMKSARPLLKVVGMVGAGAAVYPIDDGGMGAVEPPFGAPDEAIAFLVEGDSMMPAYREGVYIIAIAIPVSELRSNMRAVVTLADGKRLIKDVESTGRPGFFTLHSLNGTRVSNVRVVEAAQVIGTKEPL